MTEAEETGDLRPDMEAAVFGREVEEFVEHDRIGKYLIDRAQQDLAEAQEELTTLSPFEAGPIMQAQIKARAAKNIRDWIADAINRGREAAQLLQQERDEHGP